LFRESRVLPAHLRRPYAAWPVLPYATGAKLANPHLTVIAVGGDGDGLGISAGHIVNTGRRNLDLTYILFNNEVYDLTKGEAASTLPLGLQTKSLPEPTIQAAISPLILALAAGFTWIGRGYTYQVRHLVELIQRAIRHPGLAYLDVLQPCPTYNDLYTKEWFAGKDVAGGQPRLYMTWHRKGMIRLSPKGRAQS
jgi:2-oxoglutarate/2-oxoacid ferredoxin oxidoreductase subunit beta